MECRPSSCIRRRCRKDAGTSVEASHHPAGRHGSPAPSLGSARVMSAPRVPSRVCVTSCGVFLVQYTLDVQVCGRVWPCVTASRAPCWGRTKRPLVRNVSTNAQSQHPHLLLRDSPPALLYSYGGRQLHLCQQIQHDTHVALLEGPVQRLFLVLSWRVPRSEAVTHAIALAWEAQGSITRVALHSRALANPSSFALAIGTRRRHSAGAVGTPLLPAYIVGLMREPRRAIPTEPRALVAVQPFPPRAAMTEGLQPCLQRSDACNSIASRETAVRDVQTHTARKTLRTCRR